MEWVHVHRNAAATDRVGQHEKAGRNHGPLRLGYLPNGAQTTKLRCAGLCGKSARHVGRRDHPAENPIPHSMRVDPHNTRAWRSRS